MPCEPAKTIISKLGGYEEVARITQKHVSRVYRWTYPASRGGTGGLIPQREIPVLIAHARAQAIPLDHSDFFEERAAGVSA